MRILNKKIKEVWDDQPSTTYDSYLAAISDYKKLNARFEDSIKELSHYLEGIPDVYVMLSFKKQEKNQAPASVDEVQELGIGKAITSYLKEAQLAYRIYIYIPAYALFNWMDHKKLSKLNPLQVPIVQALLDIAKQNALEPRNAPDNSQFYSIKILNKKDNHVFPFPSSADRPDEYQQGDMALITLTVVREPYSSYRIANNKGVAAPIEQGTEVTVAPDEGFFRAYDTAKIIKRHPDLTDMIGFMSDETPESEYTVNKK